MLFEPEIKKPPTEINFCKWLVMRVGPPGLEPGTP